MLISARPCSRLRPPRPLFVRPLFSAKHSRSSTPPTPVIHSVVLTRASTLALPTTCPTVPIANVSHLHSLIRCVIHRRKQSARASPAFVVRSIMIRPTSTNRKRDATITLRSVFAAPVLSHAPRLGSPYVPHILSAHPWGTGSGEGGIKRSCRHAACLDLN